MALSTIVRCEGVSSDSSYGCNASCVLLYRLETVFWSSLQHSPLRRRPCRRAAAASAAFQIRALCYCPPDREDPLQATCFDRLSQFITPRAGRADIFDVITVSRRPVPWQLIAGPRQSSNVLRRFSLSNART